MVNRLSIVFLISTLIWSGAGRAQAPRSSGEMMIVDGEIGSYGGRLVVGQRAEPKTLQPVFAVDAPSREVIRLMSADLIHINRLSQKTEPAVAKSWTVSQDGRRYTLQLRRDLLFSDGHPMDADDVVFTFRAYLDEKNNSPQRDLLLVDGKPVAVTKIGSHTVQFELAQPYAAAERLFDSIAVLPRHLLEKAYEEGKLAQTWGLTTDPAGIAGMGPFRLKKYLPGDRILLAPLPITNCTAMFRCPINTWGMMREERALLAQKWDPDWKCVDLHDGREIPPDPACDALREASRKSFAELPNGRPNR